MKLLKTFCMWGLLAAPAHGALIIGISPTNTNAAAGSSGFFDVTLTNNTAATPGIAGFSFSLTSGSANLTFTGATTAVANYIFAGNSFANDFTGGDLRGNPGFPPTFPASDTTSNGLNRTLAGNSTVGLGRVFFSVAGGASAGPISVTVANTAATSLSDSLGRAVALGTSVNGTVTVTAGALTPEPGTFGLLLLALPGLALLKKRQ